MVHRLRAGVARGEPAGCPGAGQRCPLLYQGGLTHRDDDRPRAQAAAQEEVADAPRRRAADLGVAVVAVEPPTGYVRAMVGGRDWNLSQVNTALARAPTGVELQALRASPRRSSRGIQPSATYSGAPYTVGAHDLRELRRRPYGTLSLDAATTNSVNGVFVRLIEDVSVRETFDLASRLGISMPDVRPGRLDAQRPHRRRQPGHGLRARRRSRQRRDVAARDGVGLRRVRQPRAPGTADAGAARRSTATARSSSTTPAQPRPTQVLVAGGRRQRHRRAAGRAHRRHRRRPGPRQTGRPPARPAPPRRTPTPGSSATRRRCRRRCGSATATAAPARSAGSRASPVCAAPMTGGSVAGPARGSGS